MVLSCSFAVGLKENLALVEEIVVVQIERLLSRARKAQSVIASLHTTSTEEP